MKTILLNAKKAYDNAMEVAMDAFVTSVGIITAKQLAETFPTDRWATYLASEEGKDPNRVLTVNQIIPAIRNEEKRQWVASQPSYVKLLSDIAMALGRKVQIGNGLYGRVLKGKIWIFRADASPIAQGTLVVEKGKGWLKMQGATAEEAATLMLKADIKSDPETV